MDLHERLRQAIATIEISPQEERNALELAYSFEETGILPFAIKDDCIREVIALVKLAGQYPEGIPDVLKP